MRLLAKGKMGIYWDDMKIFLLLLKYTVNASYGSWVVCYCILLFSALCGNCIVICNPFVVSDTFSMQWFNLNPSLGRLFWVDLIKWVSNVRRPFIRENDFLKICRICTPFQDALAVKVLLGLLEGLWSNGGFNLMVSGYPHIFSAP